jgi:hypothetical protein
MKPRLFNIVFPVLVLLFAVHSVQARAQMGDNIRHLAPEVTQENDNHGGENQGGYDDNGDGHRGHEPGGCEDSPENPTLILAGIALGVGLLFQIKRRVR